MNIYTKTTVALGLMAMLASPMAVNATKKDKSNKLRYVAAGIVGGVAIAAAVYWYRDELSDNYKKCSKSFGKMWQDDSKKITHYYNRLSRWVRSLFFVQETPKSASEHFEDGVDSFSRGIDTLKEKGSQAIDDVAKELDDIAAK